MNEEIISRELSILFAYMESLVNDGLPTLTLTPEYLVIAILQKRDCMAYKILSDIIPNETFQKIHHVFYESASRKALRAIRPNSSPKYNDALVNIINNAQDIEFTKLASEKVTSLHILLSLLNEEGDEKVIRSLFKKAGATYELVLQKSQEFLTQVNNDNSFIPISETFDGEGNLISEGIIITDGNNNPVKLEDLPDKVRNAISQQIQNRVESQMPQTENKGNALETLCTNINALVEKGEIDPLVGRNADLSRIINVLGRKKKNNVVIVGADGVGKTAICEGLAGMIVRGEAPQFLADKTIWMLNLAALVAGTQFRGILEAKVLSLINELKANKRNILFIDDIASAFSEKKNVDMDLPMLLNPVLTNGEIQVIGTCGYKGYKTSFESNPSLARKFQKVILEESTEEETIEILRQLKPIYEEFHKVTYTDEAIESCVKLAKRYIPERHLPDSAIDVFDECGAEQSIIGNDNEETYRLKKEIYVKKEEIRRLKSEDKYDEIETIENDINTLRSELRTEFDKINQNKENTVITQDMIRELVSRKSGMPIVKLDSDEKKNIMAINDVLKKSIIGQDEAIDAVCRAIKRNKVGLGGKKTMGAFLMAGKTGVGKSLLAKQLATELFGSEKYLIRIDMSEYEDKTAVNKLIGASAGYIGFDTGGVLTEAVRNKKYGVLLLDEFEKASPEVYNLFLQVFDEGFLSDNVGQRISFKDIIVILTSNVGARAASDFAKGMGFDNEDNTMKIFGKELKNKFSPEFLNRLDDVIYFNTLTEENMYSIIRLELGKLNERLNKIGYSVEYTDDVVKVINDAIDAKDFGARPVLRTIQDKIENPITDLILSNDYQNHTFQVSLSENELNII